MEVGTSETKMCNNCKRDISAANFVMHEMHCKRHIVLCEHCKEPVPRAEIEQHFNDLHVSVPCERCKQNVSKEKMEQHMSSECERRPVHCEFCELSVSKMEFDSHADFCGSRTECCPLCQQYVMLKDMLRHENSGCTYPPPKPAPPPQLAPQVENVDPFSMLGMHQLLGGDNFDASDAFPDFTANLRRELQRNGESHPQRGQDQRTRNSVSAAKPAARRATNKEPARKKTDVNIQRANNLSSHSVSNKDVDIPPDLDYDTMLALQLAHDDWLQDDEVHTDGARGLNAEAAGRSNITASAHQRSENSNLHPENHENEATIPCEFCQEEVPLESYMEHVDICQSSSVPTNNSVPFDLNNGVWASPQAARRPSIPVINNLRTPASMQRYQDLSPDFDEFMLPCEFCEEMFPSEIIIQHQSVCQANGMVTPRTTTPATGNRGASLKSGAASQLHTGQQSGSSLLDFVSDLDGDFDENHFSVEPRVPRLADSSSNKYRTPVDRFDDAVARPPRRPPKSSISEDVVGNHQRSGGTSLSSGAGEARGVSRAQAARRENSSAHRARARLNQLMQEDVGQSSISPENTGAKGPQTDRKSNVNSRSVMRQLDAAKTRPGKNRSTDKQHSTLREPIAHSTGSSRSGGLAASQGLRHSQPDSNTSRNNSSHSSTSTQMAGSGSRTRHRADHVFSPELRLKPDHNPRNKQ